MKLSQKILSVVLAIVGVLLTLHINNALALDQSACGDWEGCIGRYTQEELGSFDASGVWQWNITDPDLLQAIADDAILGDNDTTNWSTGTLLTPTKTDIAIDWAVLRNRIGPSSNDYISMANGPDASIMLDGFVDVVNVPEVYKMQNEWGIYIQVAHYFNPEGEQTCNDFGWDSPECQWWFQDNDGDGLEDHDDGVMFYKSGGAKLTEDNVASITWVEKGITVGVRDNAFEHFISMKYDMNQNILEDRGLNDGRTLYFDSFGAEAGPAAVDDHNFTLTLKDGRTHTFMRHAASNRLMPTVPSTMTQTINQEVRSKSGKVVKGLSGPVDVVINNMTAREIADEDGATRLLIQWAEPDLAMMLSEYNKDVRLRVWVGNHWLTPSPTNQAYFLWMDLPVTSGSVVVPPDAYAWVKSKVQANGETELQISGQYREQFDGFHNRGYMGTIYFPIQ